MQNAEKIANMMKVGRSITTAKAGDENLGPLSKLPGTWKNLPNLPGRGWNMIALPFDGGPFKYRLLLNQYNETLTFSSVDGPVPNRGLPDQPGDSGDQILVALDYEQSIEQIDADDSPHSGLAGGNGLAIHHEPGLWLHMLNKLTNELDIARLATIPHGDSVLAMGRASEFDGAPTIPNISGLPIGVSQNLSNPYLDPYNHFHTSPFNGLFDPTIPNDLLQQANQNVNIVHTTELEVDTTIESGGIVNIPFVVKQANAADMKSTFWIQELDEPGIDGERKLRLQYSQVIFLDFFDRTDGMPGLIRWPHISINTLEKVSNTVECEPDEG